MNLPRRSAAILDAFSPGCLASNLICIRHEVGWPWPCLYYTISIRDVLYGDERMVRDTWSGVHWEGNGQFAIARGVVGVSPNLDVDGLTSKGLIGIPVGVTPLALLGNVVAILLTLLGRLARGSRDTGVVARGAW